MNEQLTPAQRVGIDGVRVKAVVGRYNAIRLTATMVNALAGVGGIKRNWKRPPSPAYTVLCNHYRLIEWERLEDGSGRWILTERGRAWLRAEGLLRDEPAAELATTTPVGTRVRTADTGAYGRVVKIVPTGNPAGMFRHSYVIELDGGQRISRMPDRFSRVDESALKQRLDPGATCECGWRQDGIPYPTCPRCGTPMPRRSPSATPCDCGRHGMGMHAQNCALIIAERGAAWLHAEGLIPE